MLQWISLPKGNLFTLAFFIQAQLAQLFVKQIPFLTVWLILNLQSFLCLQFNSNCLIPISKFIFHSAGFADAVSSQFYLYSVSFNIKFFFVGNDSCQHRAWFCRCEYYSFALMTFSNHTRYVAALCQLKNIVTFGVYFSYSLFQQSVKEKRFLYDIVANGRNSIDVDK